MVTKTISGNIKFELIMDNEKGWQLTYDQSAENDLAVLAIGRQLMEYSEVEFSEAMKRPETTTVQKKSFKVRLEKVRAAKFGLSLICEFLAEVLDDYQKWAAENSGPKLTPEQKEELEKMKRDLTKLHNEGKI